MKEGVRNSLVGLFIIGALVMLAVLMVWFGETPQWLRKGEWTLTITGVKEIRGVGEGSPVLLNGVEIGRVVRLDFKDRERPWTGVLIIASIKDQYSVPDGAIAKVHGAVFGFGSGKISIVSSDAPAPVLDRDSALITGEMAPAFGEFLSKDFTDSIENAVSDIGELAAAAKPVAENLSRLLEQRSVAAVDAPGAQQAGILANVSTVIERLDKLVANINNVVGDEGTQSDLKDTVSDLRAGAENLRNLVTQWSQDSGKIATNVNEGIDNTEERIAHTLRSVEDVLGQLNRSAVNLTSVLESIAQGKGTAGLLVSDERLYESAVLALQRMGELVATIQRIAGKIESDGYITVGQKTVVGTLTKDFPVGTKSSETN